MVTHFSSNGLDSACGRSSQTLVSTAVTEDVSCKSCQRSLVKPDAGASAKSKAPSLAELRKTAKAQQRQRRQWLRPRLLPRWSALRLRLPGRLMWPSSNLPAAAASA